MDQTMVIGNEIKFNYYGELKSIQFYRVEDDGRVTINPKFNKLWFLLLDTNDMNHIAPGGDVSIMCPTDNITKLEQEGMTSNGYAILKSSTGYNGPIIRDGPVLKFYDFCVFFRLSWSAPKDTTVSIYTDYNTLDEEHIYPLLDDSYLFATQSGRSGSWVIVNPDIICVRGEDISLTVEVLDCNPVPVSCLPLHQYVYFSYKSQRYQLLVLSNLPGEDEQNIDVVVNPELLFLQSLIWKTYRIMSKPWPTAQSSLLATTLQTPSTMAPPQQLPCGYVNEIGSDALGLSIDTYSNTETSTGESPFQPNTRIIGRNGVTFGDVQKNPYTTLEFRDLVRRDLRVKASFTIALVLDIVVDRQITVFAGYKKWGTPANFVPYEGVVPVSARFSDLGASISGSMILPLGDIGCTLWIHANLTRHPTPGNFNPTVEIFRYEDFNLEYV